MSNCYIVGNFVSRLKHMHWSFKSVCNKEHKGVLKNILKDKSNFTLLLYIPFLGIGEWYFKCV